VPAAERFIRAGDLRLRVSSVAGDGRPLLLIGGIGANVEMWRPLRRALGGRPTIAFDAPGTGRSQTPRWPLRMRGLAAVVARLLDALGEWEVDVLGYSFGGALAQQLAHDRARRVRRLILASTSPGLISVPPAPHVLVLMATPWRYYSPRHLQRVAPMIAGGRMARDPRVLRDHMADRLGAPPSLRGYQWQLAAMTGWTSAHWLHRLTQPTLVLAGDDDPLVPLANARYLAHRIPRARLHVVPGAGHLFLIDQPDDVVDVVSAFLAKEQS
jgi:poly(3-hydroxyalkanoate) depolymerase